MDLCTLQELKNFMGITDTDATRDANLTIYIQAISKQIQKFIGRDLEAKDYVEKYEGTDTTELVLNNYPVNSITGVEYVLDGQVYQLLDDYEYDLDEEAGILYKDDGWTLHGYSKNFMSDRIDFPRRHIRVTYNGGYTNVPIDLKLVCMQYVSDIYIIDTKKKPELKSYKIDDISYEFRDELEFSENQLRVINLYKGVRI